MNKDLEDILKKVPRNAAKPIDINVMEDETVQEENDTAMSDEEINESLEENYIIEDENT